MKQNEQHLDQGSRWALYHGTSTARLKRILGEDRLRRATVGDQKIALTTERSVAEYFACNAVFGDKHDHPEEESTGVILVLDGEGLLLLNYDLAEFRDPIWGDGECDWENEIECRDDIEPVVEVLIGIESVPAQRYRDIIERGPAPFKPAVQARADFELTGGREQPGLTIPVKLSRRPPRVMRPGAGLVQTGGYSSGHFGS